jgi:glycosyltransferase involved in cell wall biosynthesis
MKILALGPSLSINEKSIGGIVVLFDNFTKELINLDIDFVVIDTNKSNYKNKTVSFFSIILQIIVKLTKCSHLSLHGTAKDFVLLGPIVIILSKIFRKEVSLRKFAGNFDDIYIKSGFIKQTLIRFVLKGSDLNFFETKYLMKFFSRFNKNTHWFPNVRKKSLISTSISFDKKFIYVGHIKEEKGVEDLFSAIEHLPSDYQIDFYGNISEEKYKKDMYWQNNIVSYKGVLNPLEVQKTISEYDVLILPSYREGYPGVIIEAFSVGVPVIATNLEGISEIVKNNYSGILVPVKDALMLADSIMSFNRSNYPEYSLAAKQEFLNFDSELQTERIIKLIKNES